MPQHVNPPLQRLVTDHSNNLGRLGSQYLAEVLQDAPQGRELILLCGEPGIGKSFTIKQLATCDQGPIALPGINWQSGLNLELDPGQTLVCFDALDEVTTVPLAYAFGAIAKWAQAGPTNLRCIVTCREAHTASFEHLLQGDSQQLTIRRLRLLPFSVNETRDYLNQELCEAEASRLLANPAFAEQRYFWGSHHFSSELLSVPRYLGWLVQLAKQAGVDALSGMSRVQLFEQIIAKRLEAESQDKPQQFAFDQLRPLLLPLQAKLALAMKLHNTNYITEAQLAQFFEGIQSNHAVAFLQLGSLKFFAERAVLKPWLHPDGHTKGYQFENQEFFDFLAAWQLRELGRLDQGIFDLCAIPSFGVLGRQWLEVLAFVLCWEPGLLLHLFDYLRFHANKGQETELLRVVLLRLDPTSWPATVHEETTKLLWQYHATQHSEKYGFPEINRFWARMAVGSNGQALRKQMEQWAAKGETRLLVAVLKELARSAFESEAAQWAQKQLLELSKKYLLTPGDKPDDLVFALVDYGFGSTNEAKADNLDAFVEEHHAQLEQTLAGNQYFHLLLQQLSFLEFGRREETRKIDRFFALLATIDANTYDYQEFTIPSLGSSLLVEHFLKWLENRDHLRRYIHFAAELDTTTLPNWQQIGVRATQAFGLLVATLSVCVEGNGQPLTTHTIADMVRALAETGLNRGGVPKLRELWEAADEPTRHWIKQGELGPLFSTALSSFLQYAGVGPSNLAEAYQLLTQEWGLTMGETNWVLLHLGTCDAERIDIIKSIAQQDPNFKQLLEESEANEEARVVERADRKQQCIANAEAQIRAAINSYEMGETWVGRPVLALLINYPNLEPEANWADTELRRLVDALFAADSPIEMLHPRILPTLLLSDLAFAKTNLKQHVAICKQVLPFCWYSVRQDINQSFTPSSSYPLASAQTERKEWLRSQVVMTREDASAWFREHTNHPDKLSQRFIDNSLEFADDYLMPEAIGFVERIIADDNCKDRINASSLLTILKVLDRYYGPSEARYNELQARYPQAANDTAVLAYITRQLVQVLQVPSAIQSVIDSELKLAKRCFWGPNQTAKGSEWQVHYDYTLGAPLDERPLYGITNPEAASCFVKLMQEAAALVTLGKDYHRSAVYLLEQCEDYFGRLATPTHHIQGWEYFKLGSAAWLAQNDSPVQDDLKAMFSPLYDRMRVQYALAQNAGPFHTHVERVNEATRSRYQPIRNSEALWLRLQNVLSTGLENWFHHEGANVFFREGRVGETVLQSVLTPQIKSLLHQNGFRHSDFALHREVQSLSGEKPDFLVTYGLAGPIVIELNLADNQEVKVSNQSNSKVTRAVEEYGNKLHRYLVANAAPYGILLVVDWRKVNTEEGADELTNTTMGPFQMKEGIRKLEEYYKEHNKLWKIVYVQANP
jgi:hypothetical protein